MRFAIRDDDTCSATTPDTLEAVYGDIWGWAPITLACVPYASPQSDVVYDTSGLNGVTSIANNEELVDFLRERLDAGEIEIALHGYHHDLPRGRPEYVTGSELSEKVADGCRCLEKTFGTETSVFVPPHGRLSRAGVRAVETSELDIAREYGPRPREVQFRLGWLSGFGRFMRHHLAAGRAFRYPEPIDFGGHRSLFCYRLNRNTDLEAYRRAIDFSAARDGVFCLSAHAGRLDKRGRLMLREAIRYAKDLGANPRTITELLADSG